MDWTLFYFATALIAAFGLAASSLLYNRTRGAACTATKEITK